MVGIIVAISWPLLAGLGVVLWSKTRAAKRVRTELELDRRLKAGLSTVLETPLSPPLRVTVDASGDDGEPRPAAGASVDAAIIAGENAKAAHLLGRPAGNHRNR
jgi:hypothetical protein